LPREGPDEGAAVAPAIVWRGVMDILDTILGVVIGLNLFLNIFMKKWDALVGWLVAGLLWCTKLLV